MAGRIGTDQQANFASRLLGLSQGEQQNSLRKIASGLRINFAGDDPAGLSIAERLEAIERGFDQAQRNLQDGGSALQIADGGLSNIGDSLQRIRELTIQANNDTLTDADRGIIQKEIDQLTEEIDRQASSTSFNGRQLLDGSFASGFTVQSGPSSGDTISPEIAETSASTLNVGSIDVTTAAGRSAALSNVDTAISAVSGTRAELGAGLNRVEDAIQFTGVARENTLAALSGIRDTNFAEEATRLALSEITTQSGVAAIGQSNLSAQNVLQLLG